MIEYLNLNVTSLKIIGDTIHWRDRISKLPNVIIHRIMSYLTAKEVAQTSILSKRWNYLRTSFLILDFDQTYFVGSNMAHIIPLKFTEWQKERFHKFLGFVDSFLLRFCKLKFPMQKFRLSIGPLDVIGSSFLLDKWIGLAVENEVKELNFYLISRNTVHLPRVVELDDMYILPQTIFSAKSMTTLEVCGCKLEQPSVSAGFHFLKNVKLVKVLLNEQIVQMLITECPLLENLLLHYCSGLKHFCVSDALKLKVVEFFTSYDEVESIEIAAPCIQKISLWFSKREPSCVIDIFECPLLK